MNPISLLAGLTAACLVSLNATISFAGNVAPQPAPPGAWVFIGDIRTGRIASRDTLRLPSHTYFRSIKFSVFHATVHLESMDVTFDDGSKATIGIHADIPPGMQSHAFDLPAFRRNIRRIDLFNQTVDRFQGRGVVSVYGLT